MSARETTTSHPLGLVTPEPPQVEPATAELSGVRLRPCPPIEVLAAFADDQLCEAHHLRTLEHLAYCDACYPVVSGLLDFQALETERGEDRSS